MTNTMIGSLREVQKLDERIREINGALGAFDDRLAEVEEPALALESELSQLTERLAQMNADARRLERSADDRRARAEKMDQRLSRVSNLREEAAVQTELDLIRRAIEGDEHEALQLIDQIRRSEEAAEELETSATAARVELETRQEALIVQRETYSVRREVFQQRRGEILEHVADPERRVYEAFHQFGRPVVVAALLDDGACGHCFGVIPLQLQNEIRRNERLIRCENCGVILTTEPEPVLDDELLSPVELPRIDLDEKEDEQTEGAEEADAEFAEAEADSEADVTDAALELAGDVSADTEPEPADEVTEADSGTVAQDSPDSAVAEHE